MNQAKSIRSARWFFQYSLRAIMLLTTLACIILTIVFYRVNGIRLESDAASRCIALGGEVVFEKDDAINTWLGRMFVSKYRGRSSALFLGGPDTVDDDLECIVNMPNIRELYLADSLVTDKSLALIGQLEHLESLDLTLTNISDDGVSNLVHCRHLKILQLGGTKIKDPSMIYICKLRHINELDISGTLITNEGFKNIGALGRLDRLSMYGTKITCDGLKYCKDLQNLRELWIGGTEITENDASRVQSSMPGVRVNCITRR